VVKRQSQLTGSFLSVLELRQIARKPRGQTVLPAAVYCAKDPCAALNYQTYPSNMLLIALDRASSKVTQSVYLKLPVSPCLLVPSFLTSSVLYLGPTRCLIEALTI
jgi:hypothetical protein